MLERVYMLKSRAATAPPRPRHVIREDFERYRGFFVERLRAEVTKAFQEQELAERLDTRIK